MRTYPPMAITTGERVRLWRVARKLTQAELGSKIGLAISSVSSIERGQQRVTDDVIEKIADVVGVSMSEFYGPINIGG